MSTVDQGLDEAPHLRQQRLRARTVDERHLIVDRLHRAGLESRVERRRRVLLHAVDLRLGTLRLDRAGDSGAKAEAIREIGGGIELAAADVVGADVRLAERYDARVEPMDERAERKEVECAVCTPDLMDQAVALGADLVGGLDPGSFDRDVEGHLDVVFGIADKRGVGVDIHLHEAGTFGAFTIEEICSRTTVLGMQGRVAVSHAYGLGDLAPDTARKIARLIAESGVSIMTNAPGNHNFPPVALLRAEGVTVLSGSDNIRDSWWPYGNGDMLDRAMMIGYRSGFYTDEELSAAFDVVTTAGAKALGLEGYGIAVGAKADFVTLAAAHVPEAVVAVPKSRKVFKEGRLVAEDGVVIRR